MSKFKFGVGPVVALVLFVMGAGVSVAAYVVQAEPEAQLQTNLPLARI